MKKLLSAMLIAAMMFTMSATAFAVEDCDDEIGTIPPIEADAEPIAVDAEQLDLAEWEAAEVTTAETVGKVDFSEDDDIDQYDLYDKSTVDGVTYVPVLKTNQVDTRYSRNYEDFRYGAYLRSPGETHDYGFACGFSNAVLPSNVITIYADKGVTFKVRDADNKVIADSTGQYEVSKVDYYKKSTENGHSVYYIELKKANYRECNYMLQFETDSADTPLHYSFWFGHPVMMEGTKSLGRFTMSIVKPTTYNGVTWPIVGFPYFHEKSWLTRVSVIKTSEHDSGRVSEGYFTLYTPGKNSYDQKQSVKLSKAVFDYDVHSGSAHPAYGDYNFMFTKITWNTAISGAARYEYNGAVSIRYLYAYGAG